MQRLVFLRAGRCFPLLGLGSAQVFWKRGAGGGIASGQVSGRNILCDDSSSADHTIVSYGDTFEDDAVHADVAALTNNDRFACAFPPIQPAGFGRVFVFLAVVDDCAGADDGVASNADAMGAYDLASAQSAVIADVNDGPGLYGGELHGKADECVVLDFGVQDDFVSNGNAGVFAAQENGTARNNAAPANPDPPQFVPEGADAVKHAKKTVFQMHVRRGVGGTEQRTCGTWFQRIGLFGTVLAGRPPWLGLFGGRG